MKCQSCSRRAFMRAATTAVVAAGGLWTRSVLEAQTAKVSVGDLLVRNRDGTNTPPQAGGCRCRPSSQCVGTRFLEPHGEDRPQ